MPLTRAELIEWGHNLRERRKTEPPGDDWAWCPPELLERYPAGFIVRPWSISETLPDGATVEAFCDPENDLAEWPGPFVVCSRMMDGRTLQWLMVDREELRRVTPEALEWVCACPWFSIAFE